MARYKVIIDDKEITLEAAGRKEVFVKDTIVNDSLFVKAYPQYFGLVPDITYVFPKEENTDDKEIYVGVTLPPPSTKYFEKLYRLIGGGTYICSSLYVSPTDSQCYWIEV